MQTVIRWFLALCTVAVCPGAVRAELVDRRPEPKIHHGFEFEQGLEGWKGCGKARATLDRETTYCESKGALKLSWAWDAKDDRWVERKLDLTLTPDTWITVLYRGGDVPLGGFAIRLVANDGETYTCSGYSVPSTAWRRPLIRVCCDWWAKQFCFVGKKGVPKPGTRVVKLQVGSWAAKTVNEGTCDLYLDGIVLFEAFGDKEVRSIFNPHGVVRPAKPCPIKFEFPKGLKHPYLVTTKEKLEQGAKAYQEDEATQLNTEAGRCKPVRLWIAEFIGKVKAPELVKAPEEAEKAMEVIEADDGPDDILNPEAPPADELTDEDWAKCFAKEFLPTPADPRYLEERGAICGKCARGLTYDPLRPKWHQCPRCRRRYEGPLYDNAWALKVQRREMATGTLAAWAYRITGDERYGRVAKKIALGFCTAFERDRRFQMGTHGASASTNRSSAMMPLLDLLADTPIVSEGEEFRIRDNFINRSIRSMSLFDPTPPKPIEEPEGGWFHYRPRLVGNLVGHALKEMMWIGLASQNEDYLKRIFDSYDEAIYNGYNSEGVWWEKSIDYQIFFRTGLEMLGGLAERIGVDLYTHVCANGNCLKKNYESELKIVMPNNLLPSLNDGGRCGFRWPNPYRWYGDRKFHRAGDDLVPLPSYNLPVTGWCALRSDAEEAQDQTYVMLDYGTGSGAHAHPDTMQFILYARRKYVSPDLGVASYYATGYWTWYKNPRSHSTMTPLPTTGHTLYFEHAPRIKVVDVETPQDRPRRHRRTVALVRDYVVDLFRADSDEEQSYTWRYHNIGTLDTRRAINADGSRWHQAYWDLRDKQALRLSALCRDGTSFGKLTGLGYSPTDKLYYVAAQRKSKRFLVPSVIEPFIDITADTRTVKLEEQVEQVTLAKEDEPLGEEPQWSEGEDPFEESLEEEKEAARDKNAPDPLPYEIVGQKTTNVLPVEAAEGQAAFCVEDGSGGRDFYFASYDAEQAWKAEDIEVRAEVAMVLTDKGKPTDILMLRGRSVSGESWKVVSDELASLHVYLDKDGIRVHTGPATKSGLTVKLGDGPPDAVFLVREEGEPSMVEAEIDEGAVQFQAAPDSDYLVGSGPVK